jgi:hypothetical protein
MRVRLRTNGMRYTSFARELHDTEGRAFRGHGLKLRTRAYEDRVSCTYKAVGLGRYAVVGAAIDSTQKAKVKFEEGIYSFHSAFSKQATVAEPPGTTFLTVGDWARLFPAAAEIAPSSEPLWVTARSEVRRIHKLVLDFAGTRAEAMLEICHSNDAETPNKVEFSWKYRAKRERFEPSAVALMRMFAQALNQSMWADPSVHLNKALSDATTYSSVYFGIQSWGAILLRSDSQALRGAVAANIDEPISSPA